MRKTYLHISILCTLIGVLALLYVGCSTIKLPQFEPSFSDPSKDYYGTLVAPTGSMEPTLTHSKLYLLKKVPWENLKVGDIIIFTRGNEYVGHRIIWIDGIRAVTKGDANQYADAPIWKSQYQGFVFIQ